MLDPSLFSSPHSILFPKKLYASIWAFSSSRISKTRSWIIDSYDMTSISIVSNAFDALATSMNYVENADGSYGRRGRADPDLDGGEEMRPSSNRSSGLSSAEAGGIQWDTPTRPPGARLPLRAQETGPSMERYCTGQSATRLASKRSEKIFEDLVSLQYVILSCILKLTKLNRTGTNALSATTRSCSLIQCGHATHATTSITLTALTTGPEANHSRGTVRRARNQV